MIKGIDIKTVKTMQASLQRWKSKQKQYINWGFLKIFLHFCDFFTMGNFLGNLFYAFELKLRKKITEVVVQGHLLNLYHKSSCSKTVVNTL